MVGACHHKLDIIRNVPFTFFVRYYELIVFCILFYHTFCRRCMLYFCLSQSPLERKLTYTLSLVASGSLIMFLPEIVFCGSWVSSPELVSIFPISLYLHLMVTITFIVANSLRNPMIYAIRIPEERTGVLVVIFRKARNPINPINIPLENL